MEDPLAAFRAQQQRLAELADRFEASLATDRQNALFTELSQAVSGVFRSKSELSRRRLEVEAAAHGPRTRCAALAAVGIATIGLIACIVGWLSPGLLILLLPQSVAAGWLLFNPTPDLDKKRVSLGESKFRLDLVLGVLVAQAFTGLAGLWTSWWLLGAIPATLGVVLLTASTASVLNSGNGADKGAARG